MQDLIVLNLPKWVVDAAHKAVKATVRIHNAEALNGAGSVVICPHGQDLLELLLLAVFLQKQPGQSIKLLVPCERIPPNALDYLVAMRIAERTPDWERALGGPLLRGDAAWIVDPDCHLAASKEPSEEERAEDKVQPQALAGAEVALMGAFLQAHVRGTREQGDEDTAEGGPLAHYGFGQGDTLSERVSLIPARVTVFPERDTGEVMDALLAKMRHDTGKRLFEAIETERTVFAEDSSLDIVLGTAATVDAPSAADVPIENPGLLLEHLHGAAHALTPQMRTSQAKLAVLNHGHLLEALLRHQRGRSWTRNDYHRRLWLLADRAGKILSARRHPHLAEGGCRLLAGEDEDYVTEFLNTALARKQLVLRSGQYVAKPPPKQGHVTGKLEERALPLPVALEDSARHIARTTSFFLARQVREKLVNEDLRRYETDYARFYDPELSKGPEVGRPFLLKPWRVKGGVVLSHGYMAAPLEVRALAEALARHGYAVYAVRLPGHGTAPADLAVNSWEEWYAAFDRGYAIIRSITDSVFVGGFSTGGSIALIAAARKKLGVRGAFSICAPLRLKNYSVHLAPSIVNVNALLKKLGRNVSSWEYVDNQPENKHINYTKNPLTGLSELVKVIDATDHALPGIAVPTLVVQASKDNTVNPVSGQLIFDKLGTDAKELALFERSRHGIINGAGAEDIFERVRRFLDRIPRTSHLGQPQAGTATSA